jgi:hypothetical protein
MNLAQLNWMSSNSESIILKPKIFVFGFRKKGDFS